MTSVLSHQRPLSGNRVVCIVVALLLLTACSPKKITVTPDDDRPTRDKVVIRDAETGELREVDKDTKRDTIVVRDSGRDPVITDDRYGKDDTDYFKEEYHVALIAPFKSSTLDTANFVTGRDMRFFNYYLGAKQALQYSPISDKILLDIIDSDELKSGVAEGNLRDYDVILGGYDRTEIEGLRNMAKEENLLYMSPWRSIKGAKDNPYYIQLRPSILVQFEYISEYLSSQYEDSQITLVANAGDENRLRPFQTYLAAIRSDASASYRECIIRDDTRHFEDTELEEYFMDEQTSVFVLPYTSGTFFRTFLRKLKSERLERDVVVIGLNNWLTNSSIDDDFYNNLGVHLATWHYPQYTSEDWEQYVNQHYELYGRLPQSDDIIEGYDHMNYLISMLKSHGLQATKYNEEGTYEGLHHQIELQQVLAIRNRLDDTNAPEYLENRSLKMVRLVDGIFEEVEWE